MGVDVNAGAFGLLQQVVQIFQVMTRNQDTFAFGRFDVDLRRGGMTIFAGLWGIMNSFIGIAQTQTTNLAVVAPGIAEALLATAIGLFAAIPAVVIYNIFARMIASYKASLGDVAAQVLLLQSRDLDLSASGVKPVRTAQKLRVG